MRDNNILPNKIRKEAEIAAIVQYMEAHDELDFWDTSTTIENHVLNRINQDMPQRRQTDCDPERDYAEFLIMV